MHLYSYHNLNKLKIPCRAKKIRHLYEGQKRVRAAMEAEAADFAEAVTTALNGDPGSLVRVKVTNPRKASGSETSASQSCKVLAAQTLAQEGPASLDEPCSSTSGTQESPTIPAISFYGARANVQKSSSTTDAAQSSSSEGLQFDDSIDF